MGQLNTFQRIRAMETEKQSLFALYLCERMLPNYEFFHQLTGFGELKPLRGALNALWDRHANPKHSKINAERWQEKVDEVTPSEYGHDMLGVYPAMDACTAISTLLQGVLDKDSKNFVDVAKVSQASVAKFIELNIADEVPAEQLREAVNQHELYQYEVEMQQAMLNYLEAQPTVTKALVNQLKQMVADEGISNIGLEVNKSSD